VWEIWRGLTALSEHRKHQGVLAIALSLGLCTASEASLGYPFSKENKSNKQIRPQLEWGARLTKSVVCRTSVGIWESRRKWWAWDVNSLPKSLPSRPHPSPDRNPKWLQIPGWEILSVSGLGWEALANLPAACCLLPPAQGGEDHDLALSWDAMDHGVLLMLPHGCHSRAKGYGRCGSWASFHTDGQVAVPISRAKGESRWSLGHGEARVRWSRANLGQEVGSQHVANLWTPSSNSAVPLHFTYKTDSKTKVLRIFTGQWSSIRPSPYNCSGHMLTKLALPDSESSWVWEVQFYSSPVSIAVLPVAPASS
jgi:hypothetical protein